MTFEWNENKNRENIEKHSVSFEEAQSAFYDPIRVILQDMKHSVLEDRFFCIGKTEKGILTVRYTIRNGNIRIIGAGFWRQQKNIYETRNNIY
ncbi:MAG: BrnT family toxin [Prevotellaceae bacterium]|jgi:uncharacterized DUF497 family protein|nr:BrnT family toxin [Prevotellaceae bacterium]